MGKTPSTPAETEKSFAEICEEFKKKATTPPVQAQAAVSEAAEDEVIECDCPPIPLSWQKKIEEGRTLDAARRILEEHGGGPPGIVPEPDQRLARRIRRAQAQIEEEIREAWEEGADVEVMIRRIDRRPKDYRYPPADNPQIHPSFQDLSSVDGVGDGGDERSPKEGKPGWKKIFITYDSGSSVDITPDDDNTQFEVRPRSGPRKGKRLAAANGTPIPLHGEKVLKFVTNEGHQLSWPFISGKVKKTLKAVSTTCDAGNSVLFTKWGGYVINDKTHKYMEFERTGNTYGQAVWVPNNGRFTKRRILPGRW